MGSQLLKFNGFFQLRQWWQFYRSAHTKYQIHSPFVFELVMAVLEDRRFYYAFRDVERLRSKMLNSQATLQVQDFGTGKGGVATLSAIASRAASSRRQGRMLLRLANWAKPDTMLEIGASVGIGTAYLAWGAHNARMISLEGSPEITGVARLNLELVQLDQQVELRSGRFEDTLADAVEALAPLDLVFFDGNHREAPTLQYFSHCAARAHARSVFVFDDMHYSPEMAAAWQKIKQDPRVTLTVDFFGLSLAFFNPEFEVKQHYNIVPSRWKPWKVF